VSVIRVIVSGARETTAEQNEYVGHELTGVLVPWIRSGHTVVIVEGRCYKGGVDRAAQRWAEAVKSDGWAVENEGHPADWRAHGRGAGNIRNGEMVELGAEMVLAFPNRASSGTWDCLKQAAKAGIPGRVYPLPEED
jgi:hypothetical protein